MLLEKIDIFFFFFKQKTAYEIYQCDWSSDVCSSDLNDKIELMIASDSKEFLERNKKTIEKATNSVLNIQSQLFEDNKTKLIEKEVSFSF